MESTAGRARALKALAAAIMVAAATIAASFAAGAVFDGQGRFTFGFWAQAYAVGVGSAGTLLAAIFTGSRSIRRVAAGVLALFLATIGGLMLAWIIATRMPVASLEGAWMYSFVVVCLVGATLAGMAAATRRRRHR